MYELDKPIYLYLLLLVPVLWGLLAYILHYRKKKAESFVSNHLMLSLVPYKSTSALVWKTIMASCAIICLTLALVNPRIGTKIEKVKMQGSDVVFALDISLSMKAEDIAPNRLSRATQIISRTIDALGGDRVGIIVYAGSAYPLLPITSDYSAAKMFLSTAEPGMVSSQGTSIAEAIILAQKYFDDPTVKNKLVVVISDGEDHDEDLDVASIAKSAGEAGIKIYMYQKGFLHSKLFVCDDYLSSVGSTNMDFRSFEHNFEVNAFMYDRHSALALKDVFLNNQKDAVLLTPKLWKQRPWYQKVQESVIRLFAPLL